MKLLISIISLSCVTTNNLQAYTRTESSTNLGGWRTESTVTIEGAKISSSSKATFRLELEYDTLKDAVMHNSIADVRTILEKDKKELNAADKDGKTPLWMAAVVGSPEIIEYLLDQGAEVHTNELYELRKALALKQITPELLNRSKEKASQSARMVTQLVCLMNRKC